MLNAKRLVLLIMIGSASSLYAQNREQCVQDPNYGPDFLYCQSAFSAKSGAGDEFGDFTTLRFNHPGYTPYETTLSLNGLHPCIGSERSPLVEKNGVPGKKLWGNGSWAECYLEPGDGVSIIWKVRLKGLKYTAFVVKDKMPGLEFHNDKIYESGLVAIRWRKSGKQETPRPETF